jgi:hypothetical protein
MAKNSSTPPPAPAKPSASGEELDIEALYRNQYGSDAVLGGDPPASAEADDLDLPTESELRFPTRPATETFMPQGPVKAPLMPPPPPLKMLEDPHCRIVENPDGTGTVTVVIDQQVLKRLKLRAGGVPVATFLWENNLKKAFWEAVF